MPTYSVTKLATLIKSLSAKEVFRCCHEVKKQLWDGEFWSYGDFAITVGKHDDENMISTYVKRQGKEYQALHKSHQLALS